MPYTTLNIDSLSVNEIKALNKTHVLIVGPNAQSEKVLAIPRIAGVLLQGTTARIVRKIPKHIKRFILSEDLPQGAVEAIDANAIVTVGDVSPETVGRLRVKNVGIFADTPLSLMFHIAHNVSVQNVYIARDFPLDRVEQTLREFDLTEMALSPVNVSSHSPQVQEKILEVQAILKGQQIVRSNPCIIDELTMKIAERDATIDLLNQFSARFMTTLTESEKKVVSLQLLLTEQRIRKTMEDEHLASLIQQLSTAIDQDHQTIRQLQVWMEEQRESLLRKDEEIAKLNAAHAPVEAELTQLKRAQIESAEEQRKNMETIRAAHLTREKDLETQLARLRDEAAALRGNLLQASQANQKINVARANLRLDYERDLQELQTQINASVGDERRKIAALEASARSTQTRHDNELRALKAKIADEETAVTALRAELAASKHAAMAQQAQLQHELSQREQTCARVREELVQAQLKANQVGAAEAKVVELTHSLNSAIRRTTDAVNRATTAEARAATAEARAAQAEARVRELEVPPTQGITLMAIAAAGRRANEKRPASTQSAVSTETANKAPKRGRSSSSSQVGSVTAFFNAPLTRAAAVDEDSQLLHSFAMKASGASE